jgi:hypothetical protein
MMRDGTGAERVLGFPTLFEVCWKAGRGIRIPLRLTERKPSQEDEGGGNKGFGVGVTMY